MKNELRTGKQSKLHNKRIALISGRLTPEILLMSLIKTKYKYKKTDNN